MPRKLFKKGLIKFPKRMLKKNLGTTKGLFKPKKLPSIRNILK